MNTEEWLSQSRWGLYNCYEHWIKVVHEGYIAYYVCHHDVFFRFSAEVRINVEAGVANKYSWTACYITPWMLSMVSSPHLTLSTLSSLSGLWTSCASRRWQLIMSDWRPVWSVIPLNAWAAVHSLVPLRSYISLTSGTGACMSWRGQSWALSEIIR